MKRIVLAAALAFGAVPALAADLPAPAPPPRAPAAYVPVAAPVYNWSGIYVGINGGYGFGTSSWDFSSLAGGPASTGNFDINGPLVGGTVGVNFQTGQFVFGVEADGDWSDIKGSAGVCNPFTCQTSNEWLATIRGRIGYAFDRVLIYGTAGGAGGDVKGAFSGTFLGTPFSISSDSSEFGWTAGGGIEYGITENITARVEYLFVDLSNGSLSCSAAVCGGAGFTVPVSFETSLVRGGLDFKFGGF
jgi:outer membrane immunogenic protein